MSLIQKSEDIPWVKLKIRQRFSKLKSKVSSDNTVDNPFESPAPNQKQFPATEQKDIGELSDNEKQPENIEYELDSKMKMISF